MKLEFSKVVLAAVVLVYISTVIYAYFVVVNVPELLGELLTFVRAPTGLAIGFYCWKAKCENVLKIPRKDREQVVKIADNKDGDDNAMG